MRVINLIIAICIFILPVSCMAGYEIFRDGSDANCQEFFKYNSNGETKVMSDVGKKDDPTPSSLIESDLSADAAIFTCAMVMCGKEAHYQKDECRWFRQISHQEDFHEVFQDFKNYLALIAVEKAKKAASDLALQTDMMARSVYFGIRNDILDAVVNDTLLQMDDNQIQHNYLGNGDTVTAARFLVNHFEKHCSMIEQSAEFCKSRGVTVPEDLFVNGLMSHLVIMDPVLSDAAMQFVLNATSSQPIPMLNSEKILISDITKPDTKISVSDGGSRHLKNKFLYNMIVSLSQETLSRIYARRLATGSPTQEIISNAIKNVQLPTGVSEYEQYAGALGSQKIESERRFFDGHWVEQMNAMNKEGLYREIDTMIAYGLTQNFSLVEHLERIEALATNDIFLLFQKFGDKENPDVKNPVEQSRDMQKQMKDLAL